MDKPLSIPLVLGILFLIGLGADLVGRFTVLPRVTLLLISGLAIGPAGLALLPGEFVETWFPALTDIALALIGFLLGEQLAIPALRKRGSRAVGISLCKVTAAWLAVGSALLLLGVDPVIAVLLAGVAPATDPAATYDVVRESGVSGEFPDTLLSIVSLDDVWGLLIFILMLTLAGVLGETGATSSVEGVSTVDGFSEIGLSLLLGMGLGVPMAALTGRVRQGEPTQAEALGFVLLGAGLAQWLGALPILTAVVMGIAVASLAGHHRRPFNAIEGIEWPFMILFFVLAGASLKPQSVGLAGGLTAAYLVSRCLGIYFGARVGCRLAGTSASLRRWLGVALFPQAGVAIAMGLIAAQRFPERASVVLAVVVASTILLETAGPVFTRYALKSAAAE